MPSNFRDLAVYRRARALADELREVSLGWSAFDRDSVGLQMVRAADSISANIAEAGGRHTVKDKRHFLMIARGSLLEVEHWLDCARTRGLVKESYDDKVAAVARPLNGLIDKPAPSASQQPPAPASQ
jgi:four helix bundle protein